MKHLGGKFAKKKEPFIILNLWLDRCVLAAKVRRFHREEISNA